LQRVGNSNTFLGPVQSAPSAKVVNSLQPIVAANQATALSRQFAQVTPYLQNRLPAATRTFTPTSAEDFINGLGDSVIGTVSGLYTAARHPIDTAVNFGRAIYHLDQTVQAIGRSADDYAQQASRFLQESQARGLPTKIGPDAPATIIRRAKRPAVRARSWATCCRRWRQELYRGVREQELLLPRLWVSARFRTLVEGIAFGRDLPVLWYSIRIR